MRSNSSRSTVPSLSLSTASANTRAKRGGDKLSFGAFLCGVWCRSHLRSLALRRSGAVGVVVHAKEEEAPPDPGHVLQPADKAVTLTPVKQATMATAKL